MSESPHAPGTSSMLGRLELIDQLSFSSNSPQSIFRVAYQHRKTNLWVHFDPTFPRLQSLTPLVHIRILLKGILESQGLHHLTIWKMKQISKRQLISSKILLLRENPIIYSERGVQSRGVPSNLCLVCGTSSFLSISFRI
jgi:hypothetical protein